MSLVDASVSTALDAVSVTRWLWALKRDRGEPAEVVAEAHAAYARARAMLLEALRRETEAESSRLAPSGGAPAYRGQDRNGGTTE